MTNKTKKIRQGPLESATKFNSGTIKIGNDKNKWIITKTKNGTHRWSKLLLLNKKVASAPTAATPAKTLKKNDLPVVVVKDISLASLIQLKNKYNVSVYGSKKEIAQGLWTIRRTAIENSDLQLILHLLDKSDQKEVQKLIAKRMSKKPITNYKGLWEPLPTSLKSMTREDLIKKLRKFRDAWETITKRNQDLDDDRLKDESTEALRHLIKFYYSSSGKLLAEDFLRH